jgi:orotidine-5'-phosphate decarboxylase
VTDAPPATSTSTTATGGFLEKLRRRWHDGRTLLCVGLDPELDQLPTAQGADTETALVTFNMAIVDATADLVCAY